MTLQRDVKRLQEARRCGAKTRKGTPCQSPAVNGNRRCRMHGGAKGLGAPLGNQNAFKHGLRLPRGHVVDPYSSAPWYPYWRELEPDGEPDDPWVPVAGSSFEYMLPRLSIGDMPGPRRYAYGS